MARYRKIREYKWEVVSPGISSRGSHWVPVYKTMTLKEAKQDAETWRSHGFVARVRKIGTKTWRSR